MPAGKQIKQPKAKTIAIVNFGSLYLSERKKKLNIIKDGIIVMSNVVTVSGKLKHKFILFI